MAEFTAKDVQRLRQDAGVGMMEAKQALTDAGGDMERAFELLRERGQAKAAKRAEREAGEGAIGSYLHIQSERPVLGVLVELACETDFVAKAEEFRHTADDIAMHVAWGRPTWISRDQVDQDAVEKQKDLFARQAQTEGKPEPVIDRIVSGRMESWYEENVLYDQKFVNTERFDGTVGEMVAQLAAKMGENIAVRRVAWLAIGE